LRAAARAIGAVLRLPTVSTNSSGGAHSITPAVLPESFRTSRS